MGIEKDSGRSIKVPHSNNGGEFYSNEIVGFCEMQGAQQQSSAPYTPQQNGMVERRNRRIVQMARSMSHCRVEPNKYMVDAVPTAMYMLNNIPIKTVRGITPKRLDP